MELIHKGERISNHPRSFVKYGYSTHPEHRPASRRAHLEWTPSRLINWGKSIGPHTGATSRARTRSNRAYCGFAAAGVGSFEFGTPAYEPGICGG